MRLLLVIGDLEERGRLASHLRHQGAAVIEARDGRRAHQELVLGPVDVLIVDVSKGSGNGFALADFARRLHPGIAVIYASDWSCTERPVSGAVFLHHPVRLPALDEALRWLIDARG